MKYLTTMLTLLIFTTSLQANEDLPEAEKKAIVADAKMMMTAFQGGDAELLISKTHPAIYKLMPGGDEEAFKKMMLQAAKQIMETGVKFEGLKFEEPDKVYKSGKDSLCFIPMKTVMTVKDMKIASSSFLIAAKGEAGEWKYLDGSALGTSPEMLWTFFPDLPRDIKIPEVKMEPLEKEPLEAE